MLWFLLTGLQNNVENRIAPAEGFGVQAGVGEKHRRCAAHSENVGALVNVLAERELFRGHEPARTKHPSHGVLKRPGAVIVQIYDAQSTLGKIIKQTTVVKIDGNQPGLGDVYVKFENLIQGEQDCFAFQAAKALMCCLRIAAFATQKFSVDPLVDQHRAMGAFYYVE